MPPALVGALWRMGTVTNDDIAATLLDLAVKGVLRIEPEGGAAAPPATAPPGAPPASRQARPSRSRSTGRGWARSTS